MKSDLDEAFIGTCENCGRQNVKVRRIEAVGMFREKRGYFNICFECFGARTYTKTKDGRVVESSERLKA